jgi:LPXTG-motif cell wall-anchored protein
LNRALQLVGFALLSLGLFLAVGTSAEVVHANPNLDPAAGKLVWDAKQCKNCHGPLAEGKYGPPLGGLTRNAKTLEDVLKQVRTPFKNMPAWSTDQISDADVANVVDYLKTLPPNPDWKFAPYQAQPGDDPGKIKFNQKDCAACHGPNADRLIPQTVKSQGQTTITAEQILAQVRTPKKNMPTFKTTTVTDDDVAIMAPFITAAVEKALAAPAAAATPATPAAPATLPKTGETESALPWAVAAALSGAGLIAAGFVLRRRRALM